MVVVFQNYPSRSLDVGVRSSCRTTGCRRYLLSQLLNNQGKYIPQERCDGLISHSIENDVQLCLRVVRKVSGETASSSLSSLSPATSTTTLIAVAPTTVLRTDYKYRRPSCRRVLGLAFVRVASFRGRRTFVQRLRCQAIVVYDCFMASRTCNICKLRGNE
jgi:hypothetical protein